MRISLPSVALSLLLSASVVAQVPDICSVVFTQGIRNNYDVLTEEDRFNLYKQRILNLKSDSYGSFRESAQSLGLDLPLAEGLLGLSGTNEEKQAQFKNHYEEFRTSTYNQTKYRKLFQSHTSEISNDLLKAWTNCEGQYYSAWVALKGVAASLSPLDNFRQFVVTLDVRPALLNTVRITALEPTGQVGCRYGNDRAVQPGTTKINSAAFTMTCSKDPTLGIPFVVNTEAGRTVPINVPASSSKLAELTRLVGELRSDLSDLRSTQEKKIEEVRGEILHNVVLGPELRRSHNPNDGWSQANDESKCGANELVSTVTGGHGFGQTYVLCRTIALGR